MRYFEQTWPGILLWPLSLLYSGFMHVRNRLYDLNVKSQYTSPVPVISVGNLTIGGTGKTPTVQYLATFFQKRGQKVCIISRGYGRRSQNRQVVFSGMSTMKDWQAFGDEPVMLAHSCPQAVVVVDADRAAAMQWAIREFRPDLFLLDDAFQHRRVKRNLDIVTFRSDKPLGNGFVLPAGPLRESCSGLKRASVLWMNGTDKQNKIPDVNNHALYIHARYRVLDLMDRNSVTHPPDLSGVKVIAFCGVANPKSFRRTLESLNADILQFIAFKDHHAYSVEDMGQLYQKSQGAGADLILTTEKDWYKLPESSCDPLLRCLRVRLKVDNSNELELVLDSLVKS